MSLKRTHRNTYQTLTLPILLFVLLIGSLFLSPPPTKAGATEVITSFYSEPAHINLIGQKIADCEGTFTFWGTTSVYYTRQFIPCE
jgi:hypothetical protein